MPRLHYLSMMRFPTEKAHGLQIVQNCEALANMGYEVQLWVSRRLNTPQMKSIRDPYAHYGIERNFSITQIPCLDVYPIAFKNVFLEKIAFVIFVISMIFFVGIRLLFHRADVYYSRDEYLLLVLSLFLPREKLVFEIHQFWSGRKTAWIQRQVVQRVGHVIAITPKLAEDVIEIHGARRNDVIVAHDGIRAARFANPLTKIEARQTIGWSESAFIVGFVGRLQMLNMDKGVGTLIDALAQIEGVSLALVGGSDEAANGLRQQWLSLGLPENHFLYAGQVKPHLVPLYLAAFDICAMPHPFTRQFAYYTSPLKLFEYMAAERAIVATDLPSWSDVIQHETNALLFAADNDNALADAIRRLHDDASLRDTLGQNARQRVMHYYTWAARAKHIRNHLERDTMASKQHTT
ncbi:MAG: glycosyltransferase family 4 protein [Anaerolineae bacterium]|nr:glycosyltransferase family 4 protein [Anaerolineae bacterium]